MSEKSEIKYKEDGVIESAQRVLVTGATGFIGSAVVERLSKETGAQLRLALRSAPPSPVDHDYRVMGDLAPDTDWQACLDGCWAVVHCAARVHIMEDNVEDPLAEYRRANVCGTLRLARQAAESGVRRFIFISSIKVNGEQTSSGQPYTADELPAPADPYGVSKREAEEKLQALAREASMEVVIIRPPLVYGPGVRANFLSMMEWLNKGVPLPLGAIHNKRSLVACDNLVDLISTCLEHPKAANQVFLASDGEDLSTTELLRRMAIALGKPPRLLPVSSKLLELGANMLGKKHIAQRLCGNLQVDITKNRDLLGWEPPVSVDHALRKTAKAYLSSLKY